VKYTTESALKEIERRAGIIRRNHERKVTNILTTVAGVTLIALFAVIGEFSGAAISRTQTEYGAFILSAETGGYILTALLGFVLGVLVTLIVKRIKNK